jgi:hypothetical protein
VMPVVTTTTPQNGSVDLPLQPFFALPTVLESTVPLMAPAHVGQPSLTTTRTWAMV